MHLGFFMSMTVLKVLVDVTTNYRQQLEVFP